MNKVNVIVGRFQPLTLGHLKGAEEVFKEFGLKTVFCIVNTPDSKLNEKHPFPSEMIMEQNEDLADEKYFAGIHPIMNADIGKIAKVCRDLGCEPVVWTCGSDRVAAYKKQVIPKYIEMYDLDPEFKVHEIKRTNEDISASQVRQCIMDNDYRGYCKLMPKWSCNDRLFNIYKEYIATSGGYVRESLKDFLVNKII